MSEKKKEKPKTRVTYHGHYVSPTGGDWEIHIRPNPFTEDEQEKLYTGLPVTPGGPPEQEVLLQPNIPNRIERIAEIERKRRDAKAGE
jgi:hypothetical protein